MLVGEPDALGYDEIQDIVHQAIHQKDWTTVRIPKPVAKLGAWMQDGLVTVLCRSLISLCHLCFERQRADATQI